MAQEITVRSYECGQWCVVNRHAPVRRVGVSTPGRWGAAGELTYPLGVRASCGGESTGTRVWARKACPRQPSPQASCAHSSFPCTISELRPREEPQLQVRVANLFSRLPAFNNVLVSCVSPLLDGMRSGVEGNGSR